MNDDELRAMLIEYMGRGFLENIISLFKQDPPLMKFIPDLLADERMVVRLGATALVEELAGDFPHEIRAATPGLIALLRNKNPTIRGDTANVLGLIRDATAQEALRGLLNDDNPAVRELAGDALEDIKQS